jgi:hypothetical protein
MCSEVAARLHLNRVVVCELEHKSMKTQDIYFSHQRRQGEVHLTLKGRNIPLRKSCENLGVTVINRVTWRMHIETIPGREADHSPSSNARG